MIGRSFTMVLVGVALLSESPAQAEDEIPPDAFLLPLGATQENTLEMCQDSVDNDNDRHVDCDDQDCEIFAICAKPEEPAALVEQPQVADEPPPPQVEPATVQPRPDPEGQPRTRHDGFARSRRPSRAPKILRIISHATFWPGLLIAGISGGVMIAQGGDDCGGTDFTGVCTSMFVIIGGALMAAGITTGIISIVKRGGGKQRSPGLVLAPVIGDDVIGFGGAVVF